MTERPRTDPDVPGAVPTVPAAQARFKRPKVDRFVEALLKNNDGKVLNTELRDWL